MDTKELIEKQIEEAAGALDAAVRSRQSADLNSTALFLNEFCGRLLEIVQNQQNEIEALKSKLDELKSVAHDHIGGLL